MGIKSHYLSKLLDWSLTRPHVNRSYWANAALFSRALQFRITFKGSGLVAISLVRNRFSRSVQSRVFGLGLL